MHVIARLKFPSSLRAWRPYHEREVDLFICFFRHRARLPRRLLGRAFPVVSSGARATGVGAVVCQSAKTSAFMPAYCRPKYENVLFRMVGPRDETGAGGLAFCNAKGLSKRPPRARGEREEGKK